MPSIAVKMRGSPRASFVKRARGTTVTFRRSWLLGKREALRTERLDPIMGG
jgi:hypothetical protein